MSLTADCTWEKFSYLNTNQWKLSYVKDTEKNYNRWKK